MLNKMLLDGEDSNVLLDGENSHVQVRCFFDE